MHAPRLSANRPKRARVTESSGSSGHTNRLTHKPAHASVKAQFAVLTMYTSHGLSQQRGETETRSAAITALLDRGELVEVRVRANPRGALSWKVWTRERAGAAGIGIIEQAPGSGGEP